MTFRLFIMEKMGTLLDETIHIMPRCAMHLHGHWNKVVPFMKPFILVDLNNGIEFRIYTYWSTDDTQSTISYVVSITTTLATKT